MFRNKFYFRILTLLLVLLATLQSLQALDYGIDFNNTSGLIGTDTLAYSQRDTVSTWLSLTTDDYLIYAKGFYQFKGDFSAGGSVVVPYRFDIDKLYAQIQLPEFLAPKSLTLVQLGRFDFNEASGRVLSGPADGVLVRQNMGTAELALQIAATGLTAQADANIIISAAEYETYKDNATRPYLAPAHIIFGLRGKMLEVVERHDISLDFVGSVDTAALPLNTFYTVLAAEGRPLQWFKWRAFLAGEAWSDARISLSMAAGAKLQVTLPRLLGLVAVTNLDWACGSVLGLRQFVPINQNPLGIAYPTVFSDVVTLNQNVVIRPLQGLATGVSAYAHFKASGNKAADPDFPETATAFYLGSELDCSLDYRLTSELNLGLNAGIFFPNNASDAFGPNRKPNYLGSLALSFAL